MTPWCLKCHAGVILPSLSAKNTVILTVLYPHRNASLHLYQRSKLAVFPVKTVSTKRKN